MPVYSQPTCVARELNRYANHLLVGFMASSKPKQPRNFLTKTCSNFQRDRSNERTQRSILTPIIYIFTILLMIKLRRVIIIFMKSAFIIYSTKKNLQREKICIFSEFFFCYAIQFSILSPVATPCKSGSCWCVCALSVRTACAVYESIKSLHIDVDVHLS